VLLIIIIIISVGVAASVLQSSVSTVMDGGLAKGEAEKRMTRKLKKHAIVFGYGQLGRYVTEKLDDLGFDYVVITKDQDFHKTRKKYANIETNNENQAHSNGVHPIGLERILIVVRGFQAPFLGLLAVGIVLLVVGLLWKSPKNSL
jgi:voltage-gated potassium channel Kch